MRVALGLRGDYAVRAMLVLAAAETAGRPVSVRRIADVMDIPVQFLPQVMTDLARAGLVAGAAGRAGGYRLRRPATDINVLEVVDAVEPGDEVQRCVLRGGPCGRDGLCAVHEVFAQATDGLRAALSSQSLAQLAVAGGIESLLKR
jgi:Rrf2 family protein